MGLWIKERHPAAELCACSGAGCVSSPKHTGQQSVINPEKREKCCGKNTCDWTDMHLSCLILFPGGGNNNQFYISICIFFGMDPEIRT